MIDIHTHILPNIDDGSQDLNKSIGQLQQMAKGGIKRVYLTSHYYRDRYDYSRAQYDAKLETLVKACPPDVPEILPGFEVYLQHGIVQQIMDSNLCLGDSKYVLIESDLNGLPMDFYHNVYPILHKGYKPILAHAERYVSIMKRPSEARKYIGLNVYMQVNAGSLMGFYGEKVKETAIRLLKEGWVHIVASDDHVRTQYGAFFKAWEWIAENIDETTANLLMREHPALIKENKKIPLNYVEIKRSPHRKRRNLLQKMLGLR